MDHMTRSETAPVEATKRERDGSSAPRFEAISQPRAHDFVVEQIRRQIALGVIPPRSALPPERELVKLFGVGRVTVQLAIGQLEAERVIETRRGRAGGSFVVAPSTDDRALDYRLVEVRRGADRVIETLDYRKIIEPAAAAMAAQRCRKPDLREIESMLERAEAAADDAEFMRWDTAFHLAVASASRNHFLVEGVEKVRLDLSSVLSLLPDTDVWHGISNREHREIFDALQDKDPERAAESMRQHAAYADKSVRTLLKTLART
jgi:DNA-binding FadR family transcriptional regulator